MEMGYGVIIVIVAAVLTGAFGVLRDLDVTACPWYSKRAYASIAVMAAALYYALAQVGLAENLNVIISVGAALTIRLFAIWRGWALPVFDYQGR